MAALRKSEPPVSNPRVILVVRRGDPRLLESMRRRFADDPGVTIVLDRRVGERRRRVLRVEQERRQEQRREWDVLASIGWVAIPVEPDED